MTKTIDNDVWGTDVSFGFDSAVTIATDAIDRLHSTASAHQRVMVKALRMFMLSKKIECRPVWKPMHKQPVYADAGHAMGMLGVALIILVGQFIIVTL